MSSQKIFLGVIALFGAAMAQMEDEAAPGGKKPEVPGMQLGDSMALSIPTPLLMLLAIAFIGGMAFVVRKILAMDAERNNKKKGVKSAGAAAPAAAGSAKGSRKAGAKKAD